MFLSHQLLGVTWSSGQSLLLALCSFLSRPFLLLIYKNFLYIKHTSLFYNKRFHLPFLLTMSFDK